MTSCQVKLSDIHGISQCKSKISLRKLCSRICEYVKTLYQCKQIFEIRNSKVKYLNKVVYCNTIYNATFEIKHLFNKCKLYDFSTEDCSKELQTSLNNFPNKNSFHKFWFIYKKTCKPQQQNIG